MTKINFGTGGFRAIIGDDFNKENVQLICQAISNIIEKKNKKREICIGYDNRFMSETFAIWCSEVFAGNGINVDFFDCATSTPVVMFATKIKENDFGIMITASHNPYQYNGVKVFVKEGKDAGIEDTNEIEKEISCVCDIKTARFDECKGDKIVFVNYMNDFVDNIVNLLYLQGISNLGKVVFDAKFGSTVEEIHLLAKKIGLDNYQIINSKRDAFFGFSVPAPSKDNLNDLKQSVIQSNASIGFSLDADGDRLAVIDEEGNYIDNNYILAVVYYFLVKYCGKKGGSIKNVATSNFLNRVTEKLGYTCREVPVGFKFVFAALKEDNAVVGGESSGGLAIEGHIGGKDSLIAIALCLKAMSIMKKSFKQVLDEVKEFVGGYEKVICDRQYNYSPAQKVAIDKILFDNKQTPKHLYEIDKIVVDGYIKVYYKNGNWSLIRFSGTEPVLRIFAEADSEREALKLIKDWEKLLNLK